MLPEEAERSLDDLTFELIREASMLAGRLNPTVQGGIGALVRSMNCYYSNLIEGHDTHPRDIDRALAQDFSAEPTKRALQLEAVAHIEVQRRIDEGGDPPDWPASGAYAQWLHRSFCARLPEELLWVENPDTAERLRVVPGELRRRGVAVGRHIPPDADELPRFMARFDQAYDPKRLNQVRQVQSVGAVHHRLLWIHPFLDGNGRVARLMSHALFKRVGIGSSLWSVSRGLARNAERYKALLQAADGPRRGDRDGRGNLTQAGLVAFCGFFLEACLDQVRYMTSVLEPQQLLRRIEIYTEDEARAGRLPKGAYPILREALLAGELSRGEAGRLSGYQERKGREVVSTLLKHGLLVATDASHKSAVRLGFPIDVVERWFPRLYPAGLASREQPGCPVIAH
ncbi:Fic family protein [Sphingomonas sp. MAH-20]|uniref:Fic family protein n=2 Tax=Sphingomonadaceae TaxID=41297 RepID=A0A6I4IZM8_9SPHN|nr:Fic family protein [Sphingomonas sp. CGMCC 1.13658]MVO77709.1 Fic family protein [Sphingomonas horti]